MSGAKLRQEAERWYRQANTRYPDALAELTPAEAFTQKEAHSAIAFAREILNLAESRIYSVSINPEDSDSATQQ